MSASLPNGGRRPDVRLASDWVSARVVWGSFALVVIVTLGLIAWAGYLEYGERAQRGAPMVLPPPARAPTTISGVRQTLILIEHPGRRLFDEQRQTLESFGWVDRERGIVHIPIDAAMDRIAQQHGGQQGGEGAK